MSAPDRIWAWESTVTEHASAAGAWSDDGGSPGETEYVRADLCAPTSDARVQAMVEVGKRVHDLSCGDSSPAEWEVATLELRAALRDMGGELNGRMRGRICLTAAGS